MLVRIDLGALYAFKVQSIPLSTVSSASVATVLQHRARTHVESFRGRQILNGFMKQNNSNGYAK